MQDAIDNRYIQLYGMDTLMGKAAGHYDDDEDDDDGTRTGERFFPQTRGLSSTAPLLPFAFPR